MKKLFAVAAFLLASTAAQAQYTFEYGGRTIRIDPDRGTVSIPGVYDNTGRRTKRSHGDQDSDRPRKQTPQQAKIDPQAPAGRTCADRNRPRHPRTHAARAFNRHGERRARGYRGFAQLRRAAAGHRPRAASSAGRRRPLPNPRRPRLSQQPRRRTRAQAAAPPFRRPIHRSACG